MLKRTRKLIRKPTKVDEDWCLNAKHKRKVRAKRLVKRDIDSESQRNLCTKEERENRLGIMPFAVMADHLPQAQKLRIKSTRKTQETHPQQPDHMSCCSSNSNEQNTNTTPSNPFPNPATTPKPVSFRTFALARHRHRPTKKKTKTDLSFCTLRELVTLARGEGAINLQTYHRFCIHYGDRVERVFAEELLRGMGQGMGQGNEKDGERQREMHLGIRLHLFALIDHRLLTSILLLTKPTLYKMSLQSPIAYSPTSVNTCLHHLYSLPYPSYIEAYGKFNSKYGRFWMPKNIETISKGMRIYGVGCENWEVYLMDRNGRVRRKRQGNGQGEIGKQQDGWC